MKKCFISYCHVKPDEDLANYLRNFINENKHEVFIDTQMQIGTIWAEEITRQINASDFFIVLLSEKSILSDMVRQEIRIAYQLSQKKGKHLSILPIRIDFLGELPYDLSAYLDRIQYAIWTKGENFDKVSKKIIDAIESRISLPIMSQSEQTTYTTYGVQHLFDVTEGIGAPLPAADPRFIPYIEQETGTMKLSSPFYIKRKWDDEVLNQVAQQGSTTIIKAPRQMGKSSLLARANAVAKSNGQSVFYIDFQLIDTNHLQSLETLTKYFAHKIALSFKTTLKPDDFWKLQLGAKDNLTEFIELALLAESKIPVLFLFDEADRLFNYSFRDDFFAMVRAWHNLRAINELWHNFNLIIAHSTEPYLWIQDINQSPFNVGHKVRLGEFDLDQVMKLNEIHHCPLKTQAEIMELFGLIGGHPYLIRQALYILVNNKCSIRELNVTALNGNGPFGDHLRRYIWCLQENESLKKALGKIINQGKCDNETHFQLLTDSGLIKGDDRTNVSMRCRLYEEFFRKHLL